jgi:predicted HTH domain antitoxin
MYKGSELRAAFDSLSSASLFSSRAVRGQYYTYWRYMNVLMSSGVALSKSHYPAVRAGYSFPKVIKELSGSKATRNQEKTIAAKLQRNFHSSIRKILKNEIIILSRSAQIAASSGKEAKKEVKDQLASVYLLDEDEIDYILSLNS